MSDPIRLETSQPGIVQDLRNAAVSQTGYSLDQILTGQYSSDPKVQSYLQQYSQYFSYYTPVPGVQYYSEGEIITYLGGAEVSRTINPAIQTTKPERILVERDGTYEWVNLNIIDAYMQNYPDAKIAEISKPYYHTDEELAPIYYGKQAYDPYFFSSASKPIFDTVVMTEEGGMTLTREAYSVYKAQTSPTLKNIFGAYSFGYQYQPFTKNFIKMTYMPDFRLSKEYREAYSSVISKYEKLSSRQKLITDVSMMWSPRGSEYAAAHILTNIGALFTKMGIDSSFIMPSKTKQQIQSEMITESFVIGKIPFFEIKDADILGARVPLPSGFLARTFTESPTGAFAISATTGYLGGAILGEVSLVYPSFGEGLKKISQMIGSKLLIAGVAFESAKVGIQSYQGVPSEQILGSLITEGSAMAGFSYGFSIGISEGLPFKYFRKKYRPLETMTAEKTISGEQKLPYDYETPDELVEKFKTGEFRFYKDQRVSMYHVGARDIDIKFLDSYNTLLVKGGEGTWASEVLYGSPELSPYFLGYPEYGINYASGGFRPGGRAFVIQVENVERIPKKFRTDLKTMNEWLNKYGSRTKAYVTPEFELGKHESEVGIPKGAILQQKYGSGAYGFRYYSSFRGLRFPIYEHTTTPITTSLSTKTLADVAKGGSLSDVLSFIKYGSTIYSSQAASSLLLLSSTTFMPSESYQKTKSKIVVPVSEYSEPSSLVTLSHISSRPISSSVPSSSLVYYSSLLASSSVLSSPTQSSILRASSYVQPSYTRHPSSYMLPSSYVIPTSTIYKTIIPSKERALSNKLMRPMTKGYKTEIFRRGEWITVSKTSLTKSEAVRLGEKYADKLSLAARFRVVPTGEVIGGIDSENIEISKRFRGYKIVRGKKVPLKDEWIEKRSFRLEKKGYSQELPEIQSEMPLSPISLARPKIRSQNVIKVRSNDKNIDINKLEPLKPVKAKRKPKFRIKGLSGDLKMNSFAPDIKNVLPKGGNFMGRGKKAKGSLKLSKPKKRRLF